MGVHYEVQDLLVSYSKIYSRVVSLLLKTIKLPLIFANPRNTGNPKNPRNPKNPIFWASMAIRLDRVQQTSPIDASNLFFLVFWVSWVWANLSLKTVHSEKSFKNRRFKKALSLSVYADPWKGSSERMNKASWRRFLHEGFYKRTLFEVSFKNAPWRMLPYERSLECFRKNPSKEPS